MITAASRTLAGAGARSIAFVCFDLFDAVEHPPAEFEKYGAGALHSPALEGLFAEVPAIRKLARCDEISVRLSAHFVLQEDGLVQPDVPQGATVSVGRMR